MNRSVVRRAQGDEVMGGVQSASRHGHPMMSLKPASRRAPLSVSVDEGTLSLVAPNDFVLDCLGDGPPSWKCGHGL